MEISRGNGRVGEASPLDGGGDDVEEDVADDGEIQVREDVRMGRVGTGGSGRGRVREVDCQTVRDPGATVVAGNDDFAGLLCGVEGGCESFEKCIADGSFGIGWDRGVGFDWGGDAVSWQFGDEEADFVL